MRNTEKIKEHFRREQAAVEFDNQTPEQRTSFLKRISFLNAVKINRNILQDCFGHVLSAEPNKKDPSYKIFKDMLKWYKDSMESTKMLDVRVSNLLKASNTGQELVDQYAWYNAEILKLLFNLDSVKQELALDVIKAIGCETFNAQSDSEYEDNMIAFANYALQFGKFEIRKEDFENFKNFKNK